MVEDVEKFDAEIERKILFDLGALQDAEIGVVESGAMEEAAVGGAESAQSRSVDSERARKVQYDPDSPGWSAG